MSIITYLQDTKSELKHVSWPTRQQIIAYTSLVIIFSLVIGALLGVFDVIFNYLLTFIF